MDEINRATGALEVNAAPGRAWAAAVAGSDLPAADPARTDSARVDPARTGGPGRTGPAEGPLLGLFAGRVPVSLIMDLAMPAGPHSRELLEAEGSPDVAWWEPR